MNTVLSTFGPTASDEPPQKTAENLRRYGANQLMFFTSLYHGYRLTLPRFPKRSIYSLETDRVYYKPDLSFYKDSTVKPVQSSDFPSDTYLPTLISECHKQEVRFSALAPMCAAGRIAQERPELAVKNLYGSPDRLFLCYNNPEVRAFRHAMVRELVTNFEIDALMLDKIPQTMLEQYSQSSIFDPPLRTVGSFCFCEHCRKVAREHDLDLEEVQQRAKAIAARSLQIPQYVLAAQGATLTGDTEIPLLLLEEPLIYDMLKFRFATAVGFVRELRGIAKNIRPDLVLQAAFVPPSHSGHDMTAPRSWLTVQSYKFYADVLDEIFCVAHFDRDVVRFETERAVRAADGKTRVVSSMRLYGSTRPEEVGPMAEAALAGGSDGISFLGYDVATQELLEALGDWIAQRG